MSFVAPGLLFGMALIAVPVVLHLIMRQRPRHVPFPPLRFLAVRREANQRRLRLRNLLLLLLRCAAIALIVLALARPTIRGSGWLGGGEAPVAAALVFDTAPHMGYRHQNKTRLEAAQEIGAWLLRQLPVDSEIAVLNTSGQGATLAADRGAASGRIERLDITPAARPLVQILGDALQLLGESPQPRRELYVFTDLSRASWPPEAARELRRQLERADMAGIYLIDVGVDDPDDFGLGTLRLSAEVLAKNTKLQVTSELTRTGPEARRAVELFIDDNRGQPQKKGHVTAEWQPGSGQRIELPPIDLDEGTHQGVLRILGADGLDWNDTRYFTVRVKPAWRILVATPRPEHAIYLTEALAPSAMREKGQFVCDVVRHDQLDQQQLTDYAAVCLLDPKPLADTLWQRLAEYVTAGHGLAIFLGHNAQPVDSFNSPAAQQVLPGPLRRQWRSETFLAPHNLQHPVLKMFRGVEGSITWQAFPVFTYWQLGTLAPAVTEVVALATGHPALVEMPLGKGRVATMTTPISDPPEERGRDPWNLLPTGLAEPWPFVILSNELMLYLVGSSQERSNYLVGETVVVRLDADAQVPMVLLETPEGDRLRQSIDPREHALVVTSTTTPGNYRARAGGAGGRVDRGFSINLPPAATQLARVTETELTELLGEGNFHIARNRSEIDRNVNVGRVGQELFPYLIGLVAMAMACEHWLSNRFYREKP